ncbi:outer membrane beta-barrel protein [Pelagicoccus sp. SDUM812003]|uniref:outer membrane beta-barrel protein n=1 Tax=Pelagicoccus sp. SDUM812003 TaxID=3041267 RepID=UPI00280F6522|nr:outer membrane beta-barrel protein [Pelagicoccus sp. SDUM812003]MDQ8202126.1 outer membrane beta-barrel protein [Pelagicoccus sp. SDUM812003]
MNSRLLSLLASLLCLTSFAQAGARFGKGEINAQATFDITFTDRAVPSALGTSDTIYTFTPALTFTQETSKLNASAHLSAPISRYEDNDQLDSDSLSFGLSGDIPYGAGPKWSGSWNVSYFDGIRANYFTNSNLNMETLSASISSNYQIGRKLGLRSGVSYSDRSSNGIAGSSFLNDNETTAVYAGVHARELLGRIGAYVDYRIQDRKTDRGLINQGVDDRDDGINFGITGQILPERLFPKLEADLSFGYTSTQTSESVNRDGGSDRLTLNGSLRYPANQKTNVALLFSRGLDVTDDDRTVESSQATLSVDYTPRQRLAFVSSLGLSSNDFVYSENARNDDVLTFQVGARYSIRPNWTASAFYNLRESDSNVAISDYSSSQLSLSTTLSY